MQEQTIHISPFKRKAALIINLISHAIYLLSLPVWYYVSLFAVALFDDPAADGSWFPYTIYYLIQGYLYVVLGSIAIAWILYARRSYGRTFFVNAFPVLLVLLVLLLFWIADATREAM